MVTKGMVTDMIDTIKKMPRGKREGGRVAAPGVLTLGPKVLRDPRFLAETPKRQMAWIRLAAWLLEQGLPVEAGTAGIDSEVLWPAVTGLSRGEMLERNLLWELRPEGDLELLLEMEVAA